MSSQHFNVTVDDDVTTLVLDVLGRSALGKVPVVVAEARALLDRLIEAGIQGRRFGEGFYTYADGDLAAVLSIGFPRRLGGPFHRVDRQGPAQVQARCERPGRVS